MFEWLVWVGDGLLGWNRGDNIPTCSSQTLITLEGPRQDGVMYGRLVEAQVNSVTRHSPEESNTASVGVTAGDRLLAVGAGDAALKRFCEACDHVAWLWEGKATREGEGEGEGVFPTKRQGACRGVRAGHQAGDGKGTHHLHWRGVRGVLGCRAGQAGSI